MPFPQKEEKENRGTYKHILKQLQATVETEPAASEESTPEGNFVDCGPNFSSELVPQPLQFQASRGNSMDFAGRLRRIFNRATTNGHCTHPLDLFLAPSQTRLGLCSLFVARPYVPRPHPN